jgi:hypothetical protein
MYDISQLTPTSEKRNLNWRDTSLTFICLRAEEPTEVACTIEDKRRVVASCSAADRILAVRQLRYRTRQDVMAIDDLEAARRALDTDD